MSPPLASTCVFTEPKGGSSICSAREHVRFEMAAGAGVDLQRLAASCPYALRIMGRGLIALDHADDHLFLEVVQRALEQRGLPRTRRAHQVEREGPALDEPGAIGLPQRLTGSTRVTPRAGYSAPLTHQNRVAAPQLALPPLAAHALGVEVVSMQPPAPVATGAVAPAAA